MASSNPGTTRRLMRCEPTDDALTYRLPRHAVTDDPLVFERDFLLDREVYEIDAAAGTLRLKLGCPGDTIRCVVSY